MAISPPKTGNDDPLDKKPLGEEEDDQARHEKHRRRRHVEIPLNRPDKGESKIGQVEGQDEILLGRDDDQGSQEVIPIIDEGKDGNSGQGWLGKWHDDAPKNTPPRGTVDQGRLVIVFGNSEEELAQEKYIKGSTKPGWDDQRLQGIQPAELVPDNELGHHHHREGDHQSAQNQHEESSFARELQASKGISHQRTGESGPDHAAYRILYRVPNAEG